MKKPLLISMGIFFATAALLAAGCGLGTSANPNANVSEACSSQPSLIPPNAGKAQLIDFYRDT